MLVSIATGELHLRGSLGLKQGCLHFNGIQKLQQRSEVQTAGGRSYLTGVKLEKSAQLLSGLGPTEFHAASGGALEEEGDTSVLLGLGAGAVDVPVSMGMSSKLAVHTGPLNEIRQEKRRRVTLKVKHFSALSKMRTPMKLVHQIKNKNIQMIPLSIRDCANERFSDTDLCRLPFCHRRWDWRFQTDPFSRPLPQNPCSPRCLCCQSSCNRVVGKSSDMKPAERRFCSYTKKQEPGHAHHGSSENTCTHQPALLASLACKEIQIIELKGSGGKQTYIIPAPFYRNLSLSAS